MIYLWYLCIFTTGFLFGLFCGVWIVLLAANVIKQQKDKNNG